MKKEPRPKTALVVSGGAAKGAYAVGAIGVLRKHGIDFDLVSGTSTGALIAPLVATDEVHELERIYTSVHTSDIIRLNFWRLFKDAIYDTAPLKGLIEEIITEARYEAILASPRQIFICTVDLQRGETTYFSQRAAPGVQRIVRREQLMAALLGSSNQPLFTPPIVIGPENHQHLDGGVREVAPLSVVIDQGATKIYVIALSPSAATVHEEMFKHLLEIGPRALDLMSQEILESDIKQAQRINDALLYLQQCRARAAEALQDEGKIGQIFGDSSPSPKASPFANKAPLELVVIRPERALPASNMRFDPREMERMMAMGREAAQAVLARESN